MVEYLDGGRIQGSSTLTSSPPQTSWKELGRATLSSASDTISVSSFTAKDNLLVLLHNIKNGNCNPLLQFNSDTGSNYARRYSGNGGSDTTNVSQTGIEFHWTGATPTSYIPIHITNIANQEKLLIAHTSEEKTAGAGTAPDRMEVVGKWVNTSNQITTISFDHNDTGNFASGTELVVLGCDNDEADSGSNFWQELSSTTLTATQSGALTIPQFTTKKYLMINYYINASTDCKWKVGTGGSIDTGSNYADRYSTNGASDSTITSYSALLQHNPIVQGEVFIINKSDKEKLIIQHEIGQNQGSGAGGSGAGNVSNRGEFVGKWTNTSGQIDTLQYTKSGVSFYAGTTIKVYGAD